MSSLWSVLSCSSRLKQGSVCEWQVTHHSDTQSLSLCWNPFRLSSTSSQGRSLQNCMLIFLRSETNTFKSMLWRLRLISLYTFYGGIKTISIAQAQGHKIPSKGHKVIEWLQLIQSLPWINYCLSLVSRRLISHLELRLYVVKSSLLGN